MFLHFCRGEKERERNSVCGGKYQKEKEEEADVWIRRKKKHKKKERKEK